MAKIKHQKLADLMQTMLKAIEEHKIQVAKQLECVQLHFYERYALLGRPLMKEPAFRNMCFSHYVGLKTFASNPNLRANCQQFPMLGILLNRSTYLFSECRQSNGEGRWFIPWGVHIVLPKENQDKLERSSAQALLFCPLDDEISNEIDWFEQEMATDSFTYQLLSIHEDGRQQAILKQNLLKDPFPAWEEAKKECLRELENIATGYSAIFKDLLYNPQKIDKRLFAPKQGQSLAEAFEAALKSEQAKSHRHGQPLIKIYKEKLEKIMFENLPWDQVRQTLFLNEWRCNLRNEIKPHPERQNIDQSTEQKASDKPISPKAGRWEHCQGIDDIKAAKLIRYFVDRFIANPQDKKMGEIACVLWILIWIAEEGEEEGVTIQKVLQLTSEYVSVDDAEIKIDGKTRSISWGLYDLLSCLKGSGQGVRKHRLFASLDIKGKALERGLHEASKVVFPDGHTLVQPAAFLIAPHIYPGVRMSFSKRSAMRSIKPIIPPLHTHKDIKAALRKV